MIQDMGLGENRPPRLAPHQRVAGMLTSSCRVDQRPPSSSKQAAQSVRSWECLRAAVNVRSQRERANRCDHYRQSRPCGRVTKCLARNPHFPVCADRQ